MSIIINPHTGQRAHVFHRPGYVHAFRAKAPTDRFDYPTTLVGTAAGGPATVYYDAALGQPGLDLVNALLALLPQTISTNSTIFGTAAQPVNVIIADIGGGGTGNGGAYHYGCDYLSGGDLYLDAAIGNALMDNGLFEAELSECSMGSPMRGFNCGGSGGEGLSRVCAELVSGGPNGALAAFTSVPTWQQSSYPDWVDSDQGTDGDYPSIGCSVAFLDWLMAQGISIAQIAQVGEPAGTLASLYTALTGKTTAWPDFIAGVNALGGIFANDSPFGGIASASGSPIPAPSPQPQPQPQPNPQPQPAPTGTPITKAMLLQAIATLPD